jgi:hypothetical protein
MKDAKHAKHAKHAELADHASVADGHPPSHAARARAAAVVRSSTGPVMHAQQETCMAACVSLGSLSFAAP